MNKNNFLILILVLFAVSITTFAQTQIPDFQTIKTEKGMMVLNSNKAQPFAFLVAGQNPEGNQNSDGSLLITTKSGGLFVYFVKDSEFLNPKRKYNETQILSAHRDWDISVQENSMKTKLNIDDKGTESLKIFNHKAKVETVQNISSVYWSFLTPNSNNENRTFYQTVVLGDMVLMLGTVFDKSVKTDEIRKFFKESLESVTLLPPQQIPPKKKNTKGKVTRNN